MAGQIKSRREDAGSLEATVRLNRDAEQSADFVELLGQTCGGRQSALGQTEGWRQDGSNDHGQKKGWNHPCWTEEAFPADESSVGGKKKSSRQKITSDPRPMRFTGQQLAASFCYVSGDDALMRTDVIRAADRGTDIICIQNRNIRLKHRSRR